MIDAKVKILSNKKIAPDFNKMILEAPQISNVAKPGQFVMIRCSEGTNPLLRRPFSFHKIGKNNFEILYKVIGKGTEILSNLKKGTILNVLGPLGNGFNIELKIKDKGLKILVAGGVGVAPLYALAEEFKNYNTNFIVFLGARTKGHVLCEKEFKKLGGEVIISTEDGSYGRKGLITNIVAKKLKDCFSVGNQAIYACGPKPMLKAVSKLTNSKKIPCEISLEENMACGIGACVGCAVKTRKGYKMVCKDGPIFSAEDIKW